MVAPAGSPATADGILLVEGQDDKHVVWHLCRHPRSPFSAPRSDYDLSVIFPGRSSGFQILEKGNRPELLKSIRQMVTTTKYPAVGIMVDTDHNSSDCWAEVVKGFARTEIQLPSSPHSAGTIIPAAPGQPRVGIWLMPNNTSPGELEDFVTGMIPEDDAEWPLACKYIDGIPQATRKFENGKTGKAQLYAWLSARKEPARMGAAIGADELQINSPLCQTFLEWLTQLFS